MKKASAIVFMCMMFYACSKKKDPGPKESYPTVSYTLNTNFENQVFNTSHSSLLDASVGFLPPIWWDNHTAVGSTHVCEADTTSGFYQIHFYDSAVGSFITERTILVFNLPSLNSISNYNETSILININDTAYFGHAIISINFTSKLNTQTIGNYITGDFSMGGTVANGYHLDSSSFLLKGTFINMAVNN